MGSTTTEEGKDPVAKGEPGTDVRAQVARDQDHSEGKPTRFVIYGTPSAEVKDAVAPFNPVYMTPLAGFRR